MDTDTDDTFDFGPQPLDALMTEMGIENHELVAASTEQLTHKQVQKGRKGRRLTPKVQRKVVAALNAVCRERGAGEGESRVFAVSDLFNYHG
jgi:hypothetical protein